MKIVSSVQTLRNINNSCFCWLMSWALWLSVMSGKQKSTNKIENSNVYGILLPAETSGKEILVGWIFEFLESLDYLKISLRAIFYCFCDVFRNINGKKVETKLLFPDFRFLRFNILLINKSVVHWHCLLLNLY